MSNPVVAWIYMSMMQCGKNLYWAWRSIGNPPGRIHMRMISPVRGFVFCLALAGCSWNTNKPEAAIEFVPVPSHRILAPEYQQPTEARDMAVLLIRDPELSLATVEALVEVDGVRLAYIQTGEKIQIFLGPGVRLFRFTPQRVEPGEALVDFRIDIDADRVNDFRFYILTGHGPCMERLPNVDEQKSTNWMPTAIRSCQEF